MDVHTRDLRYFVAVAEELHFTRAARSLFISQSALSKQIAQLERALRTTLFVREGRRIALTPAGAELLPRAKAIVGQWGDAERAISRASREAENLLTIGFSAAPGNGLLSDAMEILSEAHPDVAFRMRRAEWTEEAGGVVSGHADVDFRWVPNGWTPDSYCQRVLYDDPVVVALWADHPLAGRESISFAELGDERLLVLPEGSGPARETGFGPPDEERETRELFTHVVTTVDETMEAIEAKLGVCLVMVSFAIAYERPTVRPVLVEDIPPRQYVVSWRADDQRPILTDFIDSCSAAAGAFAARTGRGIAARQADGSLQPA